MVTTLIIILTAALMIAGLVGCIVPILPGPFLVLVGALVYAWYTDFTVVSWTVFGVLARVCAFKPAFGLSGFNDRGEEVWRRQMGNDRRSDRRSGWTIQRRDFWDYHWPFYRSYYFRDDSR